MATDTGSAHRNAHRIRVAAGGRIVIPAEVRQGLGIKIGDEVLLTRDEHGIRIDTLKQAVREVQEFFAKFKRKGESVVGEILKDRRAEAEREERDFGRAAKRR